MQRVEAVQAVDAFCSWMFQGKTDQNARAHPYPLPLPALHGAGMGDAGWKPARPRRRGVPSEKECAGGESTRRMFFLRWIRLGTAGTKKRFEWRVRGECTASPREIA